MIIDYIKFHLVKSPLLVFFINEHELVKLADFLPKNKFAMVVGLIALQCPNTLNGQVITTPGYIVPISGDTVRGFIQNEIDRNHVHGVSFSTEKSVPFKNYTGQEILGFGDDTRVFKRFNVSETSYQFGKQVNDGLLTLLRIRNKKSTNYYIQNNNSKDSAFLQAPQKMDSDLSESKKVIASFLYLNQMYSVAGLPQDKALKNQVPYKDKSIRKFVSDFNRNENPQSAKSYHDNILYHHIILGGIYTLPVITNQIGYTVSYIFSEENRDLNRRGSILHGVRFTSLSYPTESFSSETARQSSIQLLPLGYRFNPGVGKVKPYAMGMVGANLVSGYSSESDVAVFFMVTVGGGLLINLGNHALVAEFSMDGQLFYYPAYRATIGYDLIRKKR